MTPEVSPAPGPADPDAPALPAGLAAHRGVWIGLLVLILAISALAAWLMIRGARDRGKRSPMVYGDVPAFSFVERGGATVTRQSLLGQVWIADFIFTRCSGICPALSLRMAGLQRKLAGREGVKLVSFSVDPQNDTPEILREYAQRYGADPERWLFLTGDWEAMRDLVYSGFKLAMERAGDDEVPVGELITHSDRLVLIDGSGRIRGYYRGVLEEGENKLMTDLEIVLGER